MDNPSAISLIPVGVVVVLAVVTRRPLQSLLIGVVVGHIMTSGWGFFGGFADGALTTLQDPTLGWIIVALGLFGSFIALLVRAGAAMSFSDAVASRIRKRTHAIVMTWLLGIIVFVDDYVNSLTVGSTMRSVTDRFRISREMLAYVVDSTATPICILIPITSWSIVVMGLLELNGAAAQGQGFQVYVSAIPYMFYGWVVVLMVPLVGSRLIPVIGPMRQAEARAEAGHVASEDHNVELGGGAIKKDAKLRNFLLPMGVLVFAFWLFADGVEIDIMQSIIATVLFTGVFYAVQGIMKWDEVLESIKDGFNFMVPLLTLIGVTFMLKDVNDELMLAEFVIETVQPFMTPQMLPAVVFIALSLVTFTSASFWGVYAIALPIVIPLAQSVGASMPVTIGAVVSAGALGSHACFYADATILSAKASGCDPIDHAFTQFPYAVIGATIATIGYILLA